MTGLSEQSAQVAEEHRQLREQVYAQQRELEVLRAFITQRIGPPPLAVTVTSPSPLPLPPSPPPPSSDEVEDLRRD